MSIRTQVLEYSKPMIDGNVIKAVKILGTQSKHGYSYPIPVQRQAMPLYENAAVFVLHPSGREKKAGNRQLSDHFGNLQNIRQGLGLGGEGLFGDLHIKESHPMAKAVLEAAASGAARFGLSHNAIVEMTEGEVTEIVEVNSVDLEDNPATTTNLFESEDEMHTERLNALEAKVDTLLERLPVKAEKTPPRRITALENITDPDEAPTIGNTHDDFLGALHGFPITNTKGALK